MRKSFTLQSRGLDETDARNLLINALAEVISQLPVLPTAKALYSGHQRERG